MIVSRDHKRMGRSFDEDDDNDDEDDVEELERKIKYSIPVVYFITSTLKSLAIRAI